MAERKYEYCHLPDAWLSADPVPEDEQWQLLPESQQRRLRDENNILFLNNRWNRGQVQYRLMVEDAARGLLLFQTRYVDKILVRVAAIPTVAVLLHAGYIPRHHVVRRGSKSDLCRAGSIYIYI